MTSPLPLGAPCDSEPALSQGTQFPHLEDGNGGLAAHSLGFSPCLTGVEDGTLKFREVVD